jgi:hypothetical protein
MKKLLLLIWIIMLTTPCLAAEVDMVFDIKPLSLFISPDLDGFKAFRGSRYYSYSEEIEGAGSIAPNARLGLGIDTDNMIVDLTGGFGVLFNDAFEGSFLTIDIAPRFKMANGLITLGPHFTYLKFDELDWSHDADIEFSDSTGFLAGLNFSVGRSISFVLSIDYLGADPFEVTAKAGSGWSLSQQELEMSGIAIQMGVGGHF